VQIWSVIGREFSLATNQLDFAVPERFNLTYVDKDGKEKTPLCIHRAPLSTHERFVGFLLEHFAGAFPLWLAPEQVRIIPVADAFMDYAKHLEQQLKAEQFRVMIDDDSNSFSKKIRNAELQKVPYILIVGEKEEKADSVSVREFKTKEQYEMHTKEFIEKIREIRDSKLL
jgi:threonyl-tRNA synthetase